MATLRTFRTLESQETVDSLNHLYSLLYSNVRGKASLIVTSRGYSEISSTSAQIVDRCDLNCPICIYISQIVKNLDDFGLYFGIATTSFLRKIISQVLGKCDVDCVQLHVDKLSLFLKETVASLSSKFIAEFSVKNSLIPIVKTVLRSKPVVNLSAELVDTLAVCVVKAFLMSLDDNQMKKGHVFIHAERGVEYCRSFQGVAYKVSENEKYIKNCTGLKDLNILLFTTSLPSDLGSLVKFLDGAVGRGVRVVACQMLIPAKVQFYLKRKSVLPIERLGEELAEALEYLSGATPISDVTDLGSIDILNFTGALTRLEFVTCGEADYLIFENTGSFAATLLVQSRTFATQDEVKVILRKCLKALISFSKTPKCVPGNGCFETQLYSRILGQPPTKDVYDSVGRHFAESLLDASGISPTILVDTTFYHAWSDSSSECNCKTLNREKRRLEFVEARQLADKTRRINPVEECRTTEGCLADPYETKSKALFQSLETTRQILDIGLIVNKTC